MAIRHVAAAVLMVCAGVAHADPIAATSAPAGSFLNNWSTGNGTDVLGSGVLGGSLNLIGGVSYGSASKDASLTDVLMGKASANIAQVDGKTQLFFSRGVEGTYLLAAGNGILAATLGDGKSVLSTADGAVIVDGKDNGPGMSGGGNSQSGGGGGGGGGYYSDSGSSQPAPQGSDASGNANEGNKGGNGNGNNEQTGAGGGVANNPVKSGEIVPPAANGNGDKDAPQLPGKAAIEPAAVPEPSSIALMLAGMLGAGAITRRRKQ